MTTGIAFAPFHERADRCRRGIEDRDLVPLDDIPEPVRLRPVRRPLVHQRRCAIEQRAIDDVRMAGHPADIGGAPVDIVVAQIEDHPGSVVRPDHVPRKRMEDPLRLAGRAGCIEDIEGMLAVERLGRVDDRRRLHQLVPPVVAPALHLYLRVAPAIDYHMLQRRGPLDGGVGGILQPDMGAAPPGDILRDEQLCAGVVHPLA